MHRLVVVTILAAAAAAPAHAQKLHATPALRTAAKIADSVARRTALAQVPGGTIRSAELEREGGRLIYSYDVKVAGKPGVEEIHVDALTGAVAGREHETKKQEKAERKADRKARKADGTAGAARKP